MEVFRPQNVYADLISVLIDLQIQHGCFAGIWSVRWPMDLICRVTNHIWTKQKVFLGPGTMSLLRNMRHSGDGKLPQDVPSQRTNRSLLGKRSELAVHSTL